MENHFKFLTLPKTSGEVANVFIHGYSSGHDLDDRRMLANSIPGALRQSVNILAFWPSSHFTQMDNRSRGLLMAAARVHPLAGAAALAGDRVVHFARIRNRARDMGKVLLAQLDRYLFEHHPDVKQVNLIGHSLGGRLLVSALKNLQQTPEHGLVVGDVLLMAAAVRIEAAEAEVLKQKISGRLINAYSSEDHVLLLNLGEKSLGRTPVEHFENVRMPGYRHHHYFAAFERASDLMGVQRHLKVIGIFARICHRDGKPRYLQDVPRFFAYIEAVLSRRPELAQLGQLLTSLQQPVETAV